MRYLKDPKVLAIVVGFLIIVLAVFAVTAHAGEPDPEHWFGCTGYVNAGQSILRLTGCDKLEIGAECIAVNPVGIYVDPSGATALDFEIVAGWEGACQ